MVGGIKILNVNYYITQGKIKEIGEIKTYSNNFTKREVVITTYDDGYPEDVKMCFIGDKSKMMDDFNVEDLVIVAFKIKSNLYDKSKRKPTYFSRWMNFGIFHIFLYKFRKKI